MEAKDARKESGYVYEVSTQCYSHDSEGVLRIFIISTTHNQLQSPQQCGEMQGRVIGWIFDMDHSFALSDIEAEEDYISVLHHVFLTFLNVFSFCFYCVLIPKGHQIIIFHDFSTDESFFEVSMDDSCGLGSFGKFADGPAPDFVSTSSEEVNEIECVVSGFNDLRDHSAFLFVLVLELFAFVFSTVGNNFSRDVFINPLFDLLEPFVFLAVEVFLAEIDKIDNSLSSNQTMGVENGDLCVTPFSMAHPLVLLKQLLDFHQNLTFLAGVFGIGSLDNFFHIFKSICDEFQILEDKF